jgi:hypothetical protein
MIASAGAAARTVTERPSPLTHDLMTGAGATIRHGFFTRNGGVSNGLYRDLNTGTGSSDDPDNVAENRRRVASHLGLAPNRLVTVHQIHSPDVVAVDAPIAGERPKADALVTATPGLALAVLTADCGPVLFADGTAGVIGAAHAGWRGAASGVLENTVAAMERLGAHRKAMVAVLGPTISQDNYEVGAEFEAAITGQNRADARFFRPSPRANHFMFDLPRYILARLEASGVAAQWQGSCTYDDEDRFFSFRRTTHRKEPDYGRQMSVIALSPDTI